MPEPYPWGWLKVKARVWALPLGLAVAWGVDLASDGRWGLVVVAVAISAAAFWGLAVNFARWRRGG